MFVCNIFVDESYDIYIVRMYVDGLDGEFLLIVEMFINCLSGDLFGMIMNVGMGWFSDELDWDGILLFSIFGGLCGVDGKFVVLVLYQGYYELDIQMKVVVEVIKVNYVLFYVVYVFDFCDGCIQGIMGMFDLLLY